MFRYYRCEKQLRQISTQPRHATNHQTRASILKINETTLARMQAITSLSPDERTSISSAIGDSDTIRVRVAKPLSHNPKQNPRITESFPVCVQPCSNDLTSLPVIYQDYN